MLEDPKEPYEVGFARHPVAVAALVVGAWPFVVVVQSGYQVGYTTVSDKIVSQAAGRTWIVTVAGA